MSEDYERYLSSADGKEPADFHDLGISNMLDLFSIVNFNRTEKRIRSYLGVEDDDRWAEFLGFAEAALGEETLKMIKNHIPKNYSMGLMLSDAPGALGKGYEVKPRATVNYDAGSLAAEVNLISDFPPIRNQGQRGTCVAHATVALREFITGDTLSDLSEQFLYWYCKENDGIPESSGTYLETAFEGLVDTGVCEEDTWPYNSSETGNEGQGPPPNDAIDEAEEFKIPGFERHGNEDIDAACAILESGKPLVFGVPVYPSWGNYATQVHGKVFMPLPNEEPRGGHAMILVGYKRDGKSPGGGYFIFRNSWGEDWARECPYGAGYGTIPFAYIREKGMTMYSAENEMDAGQVRERNAKKDTPVTHTDCVIVGGTHKGKSILGYVNEEKEIPGIKNGLPVLVDSVSGDAGWHVIFICGQAGSGKSHTLSVVIENILIDNEKEKAVVIIDAEGEHWSFKEPSPRKDALKKHGLTARGFPTKVLVPTGSSSHKVKPDGSFSFAISDLNLDDWCAAFKVKGDRQIPLLRRLLECMEKPWYFVDNGLGIRELIDPTQNYSIDDLRACLEYEEDINDEKKGFPKEVIRGVNNVLSMAESRPWLGVAGTPMNTLASPGEITVIDLSGVSDDRERVVIAELMARKLFDARHSNSPVPPMYLVVDEAHLFAPRGQKDVSAPSLIKIAKRGRRQGVSLICATQQPSATDDQLISQVTVMVGHVLTMANDVRAWKDRTPKINKRPDLSVENLGKGEAVISDRKNIDIPPLKIIVRPRLTRAPQD